MSGNSDAEDLAQIARQARILHEAKLIFERLAETADSVEGEDLHVDEEDKRMSVDEARGELEEAAETAGALSTSMTVVLAKHGYVPDFEEDFDFEEDDADDDRERSGFQ